MTTNQGCAAKYSEAYWSQDKQAYANLPVLEETEQREVSEVLQDLGKATEALNVATSRLYSRLETVVKQTPEGETGPPQRGYSCKLAQTIGSAAFELNRIQDMLYSLERRVQL